MDPNLFAVDWQQTGEVLTTIVVLAFVVERALALIFESQWYLDALGDKHLKELITFTLSLIICTVWRLDAVSIILHGEKMTILGEAVSAAVISGGSKASLKLFRDVMGVENGQAKEKRLQADAAFGAKVRDAAFIAKVQPDANR
jgi:hypothetical protein